MYSVCMCTFDVSQGMFCEHLRFNHRLFSRYGSSKSRKVASYRSNACAFRIRFRGLYWSRDTHATRWLNAHTALAYKIIGDPDGGLLLFPRRRSLPERFISLDDPLKPAVGAIRIAMMISNLLSADDGTLREERYPPLSGFSAHFTIFLSLFFLTSDYFAAQKDAETFKESQLDNVTFSHFYFVNIKRQITNK